MPQCKEVLGQLHNIGMIHGDLYRYSFLVDGPNDHVRMVDFEHTKPFDEDQV
jgi:RIO-like serine/threonine protein kinase